MMHNTNRCELEARRNQLLRLLEKSKDDNSVLIEFDSQNNSSMPVGEEDAEALREKIVEELTEIESLLILKLS